MSTPDPRRWIGRRWWTLKRFGLTPAKIARRALNRAEPRILCVTVPKSGTHLLERVLCLHPRLYRKILPTLGERIIRRKDGFPAVLGRLRPGQIAVGHIPFTPARLAAIRSRDVRCIFLVRDPRDVLVSRAFFAIKDPKHPLHAKFTAEPDAARRIQRAITGEESLQSLRATLEAYAGWLDGGALVLRFEDLIGPVGGGDEKRQQKALRQIFEHLGMPAEETLMARIREQAFSADSPTFRRGGIGEWRRHFDVEAERLLDRAAGELLARYSYGPRPDGRGGG
jgi:hypothetical protein